MKKNNFIKGLILSALLVAGVSCGNRSSENNGSKYDLADINNVVDDLADYKDENGKVDFQLFENVQINMWSVIGDPDKSTLLDLVKKFNQEYAGMIEIVVTSVGHYDYYNALDNTRANDIESFPDVCFMHNEKNIEYAVKGYFYPVDELITKVGADLDFNNVYDNIERTTIFDGKHFGIPIDAHGYLTQFRQDIVKKNNLGFDNNTRFVPQSYAEYNKLLEDLAALTKSGELWTRNINLDQNHAWYQLKTGNPNLKSSVTTNTFYPTFDLYQENDALTALYTNGGSLVDSEGKVNFHKNEGFVNYVTNLVEMHSAKVMGSGDDEDPQGSKEAMFGAGATTMFSEGPWQSAGVYDLLWNNKQLKEAKLGITAEDAADPIYNQPFTVCRPNGWWADSNAPQETANKWYGNGHVIAVTDRVTSLQKMAAIMEFARWYTQGNEDGDYYLTDWCAAGHVPAWKNVYESDGYKAEVSENMTLRALGNPEDIIALESTEYATQLILGVSTSVGSVIEALYSANGCSVDQAKAKVNEVASSTQEALDLLNFEF